MTTEETFALALIATDEQYRTAEAALITGGDAARATLSAHLQDSRRFARLLARVLLPAAEGKLPQYETAVATLRELDAEVRDSPARNPSPTGIAFALTNELGDTAVEPLAVRVTKERHWPHWRIYGVLLYLERHATPEIAPAVLRLAATAIDTRVRVDAVQLFKLIAGEDRAELLQQERDFLAVNRLEPSIEVSALQ